MKKIFGEMIPVVLGILIALFINNLKEQMDNKRFVQRVFSSIQKEMESNQREFNEVLVKQYALIDTIRKYEDQTEVSLEGILSKTNGFQAITVKNSSWRSFLNDKLELINFDCLSILTDVAESKEFMNLKLEKLMDFLLENISASDPAQKQKLIMHTLNLLDSEESLLKLCNEYLETCGSSQSLHQQ